MDPSAGRLSLELMAMDPLPTFSICMPVFNRERVITRALRSCLQQNGNDFEIVVTDDHSSDGTILAIEALQDARIRLIRHRSNQGHAPARNSAIEAARGDWIIELDSDDELLPNGLAHIRAAVLAASSDVDYLEFMYQRDDGGCSPDPPLVDGPLSYEAHLLQLDHQRRYDALRCIRRTAAMQTPWGTWTVAGALIRPLDLHRNHRCVASSTAAGLIHTDAGNRISWLRRSPALARRAGLDLGDEMDRLLARHGAAVYRYAPLTWRRFQRVRASYHFLAGHRWAGVLQTGRCLRQTPFAADVWLTLLTGLVGPQALARLRSLRKPPT